MQPPAQELGARDLHDNVWTFRHIYRGRFVLLPFESSSIIKHFFFVIAMFVCYTISRQLIPGTWFSLNPGQPKRHLLTTGWSLFVSGKRLFAGDAVLFIR